MSENVQLIKAEPSNNLMALNKANTEYDITETVALITAQRGAIQQAMKTVLKNDIHYMDFSLLSNRFSNRGPNYILTKTGADALCSLFRFTPEYEISTTTLEGSHREYTLKCYLFSKNGEKLSMGVGSCSTKEKKYNYTRDNPADIYNTCLKMAKKRSLVDAVITTTGCSDLFTQDLDENIESRAQIAEGKAANPLAEHPWFNENYSVTLPKFMEKLGTDNQAMVEPFLRAWADKMKTGPREVILRITKDDGTLQRGKEAYSDYVKRHSEKEDKPIDITPAKEFPENEPPAKETPAEEKTEAAKQ
jgi:hypothetical protein